MLNEIITGIDGSPESFDAFRLALRYTREAGKQLKLVFVVDERKTTMPVVFSSGGFDVGPEGAIIPAYPEIQNMFHKIEEEIVRLGTDCLEKLRDEALKSGVKDCATVIRKGFPSDVLRSESLSGDLLVLGQRGEHARFVRTLVGSVTEELARSTPRPLLVCPPGVWEGGDAVIACDGSASSENAIRFCAGFFGTALPSVHLVSFDESKMPTADLEREVLYLADHGIRAEAHVHPGRPVDGLLDEVRKLGAGLIVAGIRGRNAVKDYLLGSTTSHLIRKSTIPVLVIP